ncbi:hypothetical protein RBU49_04090 [Clostridium sp. MB40-C1]|uniref:hypothetical protein n=1 Tax=Clostridium sp. MB40-C1 TaxID=3070996 RepID=UPI0027DEEC2E|nr:hypothetical protein [Clostridium sp. MB40-C1]WMJ81443.1 hypothetical protein RBU49_04090 [Clostridium sp. MB40-C1]
MLNNEKSRSDILEVISYIMWSISIWYLGYFQCSGAENINEGYRVAIWFYMLSAFLFYKDSYREVTKEIIKSAIILTATNIMQFSLAANGNVNNLVKLIVAQVLYQLLAYGFVWFIKKSKEVHGRYTLWLQTIFMFVLGILLFIFNVDIAVSLVCTVCLNLLIGWHFFIKWNIEKANMDKEKKQIEKEEKKEHDEIKRLKEIEKKYNSLIEEQKKQERKDKLLQNKKRRKRGNKN